MDKREVFPEIVGESQGEGVRAMKGKGGLIFAVAVFGVLILLLITALGYPSKAAIFPIMTISVALIVLVSHILPREILAVRRKAVGTELTEAGETANRFPAVMTWLVLTLLMLWLLGFLPTVLLLPLLYLMHNREKSSLCIGLPLACAIFFYVIFSLTLKMVFYKGLLFSLMFE